MWPAFLLFLAQTPVDWPLESLKVEGNRLYTAEQILAVAGLRVGQKVTPKDFDAARQRLLETGAFQSVGFEFAPGQTRRGYAGRFQVAEVEQVYPYRFEDLPAPEAALRQAVRSAEPLFGDRIPATKEVLERLSRALQRALGGAPVVGRLIADDPNQFAIVFRPPTPRPNIAEVRFTGNQVLAATLLQNTLAGVAVGVPYTEAGLRQLLESSIRPLYEARGRIRVAFPKITTAKAANVNGIVVTVEVGEGPSYNLGEVTLDGAGDRAEELIRAADFKTGDIADFGRIQADLERIYQRYSRAGYLKVSSRVDRKVDDQKKIVDLAIHIDRGPQFTFGKLAIVGLDLHGEPAVRKLWGLKPGAPFNPEYPDHFLDRVREEGIFDNLGKTRSERHIDEDSRTVDVTLYFR